MKDGSERGSDYQQAGLEIPHNWDLELLDKLGDLNKEDDTRFPVLEVYASDRYSVTGSGRGGTTLAKREHDYKTYIDRAHQNGIKFIFLWNAISMGGEEWNPRTQKRLFSQARELVDAGVDCITVAIPLLALKLKTWFPDLEISCSVNNKIDSVEKARQLINHFNVDRLIMDNRCSRNFSLIRAMHREFSIPLTVLVNESCLPDCILQAHHQEYLATVSRDRDITINPPDLCHALCGIVKLSNPLYTLKAPWIRPEDVCYLTGAGVSYVKLAGRTQSSEWILKLARAYAKGKFKGDIWQLIEKSGLTSPEWSVYLSKKLEPCHYKVENELLDGFISPFVNGTVPCVQTNTGCGDCTWCEQWMHAVSSPSNARDRIKDLQEILAIIKKENENEFISCWDTSIA
jgi:collagenase-like PrtC family protease